MSMEKKTLLVSGIWGALFVASVTVNIIGAVKIKQLNDQLSNTTTEVAEDTFIKDWEKITDIAEVAIKNLQNNHGTYENVGNISYVSSSVDAIKTPTTLEYIPEGETELISGLFEESNVDKTDFAVNIATNNNMVTASFECIKDEINISYSVDDDSHLLKTTTQTVRKTTLSYGKNGDNFQQQFSYTLTTNGVEGVGNIHNYYNYEDEEAYKTGILVFIQNTISQLVNAINKPFLETIYSGVDCEPEIISETKGVLHETCVTAEIVDQFIDVIVAKIDQTIDGNNVSVTATCNQKYRTLTGSSSIQFTSVVKPLEADLTNWVEGSAYDPTSSTFDFVILSM